MTSLRSPRFTFVLALSLAAGVASLGNGCTDDDEQNPEFQPTGGVGNSGTGGMAGGEGGGGAGGGAPSDKWPNLECDPLVPEVCAYPFPSNVFTVANADTPTGRQIAISSATIPQKSPDTGGMPVDPTPWNKADGFSPGVALLAYLPGAALTGLAQSDTIDASLDAATSPTILLNADTGELVPHFAELDKSNAAPERAFMIRPVVRLDDATRYIVAIRNVQDGTGAAIAPSPAFKALRDNEELPEEPSVEARRELYAEIFTLLGEAGVDSADLQLAWDFHTASRESNTGWMVHMRDEALDYVMQNGINYTIDSVETDYEPQDIAFRINGTMEIPFYLDQFEPGASLLFGDDGMPMMNETTPTFDVEFELLIPQSALTTPAPIIQYGHGLLGAKEQIESGHFRTWMNTYNYAFFGVDMIGMASADEEWIAGVLVTGETHRLNQMMDRLHQGMLNHLVSMRIMKEGVAEDATYGQYLDGNQAYYHGISQGGIFGGTIMGLSTDVQRGALGVMGQSYNLLLNRSVDFDPFFALLAFSYPESRDQQTALNLIQMLWDRVEPTGYTNAITSNPLPGTQTKQVLMRAAIGDHQVTTLGAHIMARTMGAQHLDTGLRDVWGLSKTATPTSDAVYVEYDFGLPEDPVCNVPQDLCDDPHGKLRQLDEARMQLDTFLQTGQVQNFCTGPCDFSAMSGCVGGETNANICD